MGWGRRISWTQEFKVRLGNTVKILSHKTCCLLENGSGESVGSATGSGDSRSVPSLLALTGLSRFLGEPGEGQLLFPEEPDPLHHPSRTRKYLPHHICFLHQIWKESVGKKLLSDWSREGGLHKEGTWEMVGNLLLGVSSFSNLVFISWLKKIQGLWSNPTSQSRLSIKILNGNLCSPPSRTQMISPPRRSLQKCRSSSQHPRETS